MNILDITLAVGISIVGWTIALPLLIILPNRKK